MKFWFIIFIEALFAPILYLRNEIRNRFSSTEDAIEFETDNDITPIKHLVFGLHEWAAYPLVRFKQIKPNLSPFTCGLRNQISSLTDFDIKFRGERTANYHLTISDYTSKYQQVLDDSKIPLGIFEISQVSNIGMDLAGYAHIVKNKISNSADELVFLINTSVSGAFGDKINNYISEFEENPKLGLLGISYSTSVYQSLIKNNFQPHLQSFFLVARANVLRSILAENSNEFPGERETNKFAIIRFGEVEISRLVNKLGYQVGVVEPTGEVYIFPKFTTWDNKFNAWKLAHGDRRLTNDAPNTVHSIKKRIK